MGEWIIELISSSGYWGIAFLMALENIFPPIPSELIMGVGGLAVARGKMEFWPLLAAGTIGSTLGNYVWFLAGDRLGYARLQPFVRRWGRWLTLEWRDIERAAESAAMANGSSSRCGSRPSCERWSRSPPASPT